ncbi:hydroxyisourate hydrolase [Paenibacillus sp. P26]|nr:hydroxyisourate hydrolase [Paenibacillus sp. P26]
MSGRLTTHVLDLTAGRPADGMKVELRRVGEAGGAPLRTAETNADGRLNAPLLEGEELATGVYELVFYVGDYFRAKGMPQQDPPFLDTVPIRFGVSDKEAHYHVPLLVAPGGYSTYRGS